MQKNKGVLVMTAVTVIAVAAALLDYKREMDAETRKEEESIVLTLKPDQISEIEFTMREPSTIVIKGSPIVTNNFTLKKSTEGWKFSAPFEELADSERVEQFIEALSEEKGIPLTGIDSLPDWNKFGLEKPRGSIVFKDQLGKTVRVDVSTKKNFEGAAYLRKDLNSKVLLGSPGWMSKVEKKIMDFRDKRLLRSSPQQIEKFALTRGPDLFEFSIIDAKWVLDSKPTWKLDQTRVQQLINSLTGNVITQYFKESSILPDDRKKYGVSQAEVVIKILLRSDKNWNARIGALKDGAYPVEILEPPTIVEMAAVDGEKLVKLKPESLRDRATPFEFNKNDVDKIELKLSDKTLELERKDKDFPSLIEKIRALEALEFTDITSGLTGPAKKSVQLKDVNGKVLMELEIGSGKKKKVNGVDRSYHQAQSSLVGELVTIDEAKIQELGIDQMFGVKK